MNLGIGGPPKKRGLPPPPFGGGDRGGPTAKAAPAPAPKGGAGDPGAADAALEAAPALAKVPPVAPPVDEGGGDIPPEAVCYRSEMETCGQCTYNSQGQCSKLGIPVGDGDGCNLFKDREGGGDGDMAAEALEPPAEGGQAL